MSTYLDSASIVRKGPEASESTITIIPAARGRLTMKNTKPQAKNFLSVTSCPLWLKPFAASSLMLRRERISLIAGVCIILALAAPLAAQSKRLWVLRAPGEITEYDPATFTAKQTVKVPPEAATSPQRLSVNHLGQMLFAPAVSLPLDEDDLEATGKVWLWNASSATALTHGVSRTTSSTGSNEAITECAPAPFLSADGTHLFWFANQARRLQREGVDLSTKTTWQAWQTDLTGAGRQDLASLSLQDCPCPTGSCEETCPYGEVSAPDEGIGKFFLLTQFIAGKTQPLYNATSVYEEQNGKWQATKLDSPLHRVLDAPSSAAILEAVPDIACCGWKNQSDDQTLLRIGGKTLTILDEQLVYKNSDYDVSFYAENGKLSPDLSNVALTIVATAQSNKPIQLSEQGQANPEESQRIRRALLDLPAVEVKNIDEQSGEHSLRRIISLPHATLVGWISDKEILLVEGHALVAYNVVTQTRRKSTIRVEDAGHVFLR